MLIEILICLIIGIVLGIFTGLTPGIHINLVSTLILTISPMLLTKTTPLSLAIIILAMAVTHTFLDFIPSVYLGAPDPDTTLTILPAHRMLIDGKGYEAVKISIIGSLAGLILTILSLPVIIIIINLIYETLNNNIAYILIVISIVLIFKNKNRLTALLLFLLSGTLGMVTLNIHAENTLFPLLSGLFGTSMLLLSLKDNTKIPKQQITHSKIKLDFFAQTMFSSLSFSTLAGFLPGLGASQTAIISSAFIKKSDPKLFILLIGSINTIVMVISFIALYLINKSRNGAVIVISEILQEFTKKDMFIFLSCILIAGGIASILGLYLAGKFSNLIEKVNYKALCIGIIIFITILTPMLSGPIGILILVVSTALGALPPLLDTERNYDGLPDYTHNFIFPVITQTFK